MCMGARSRHQELSTNPLPSKHTYRTGLISFVAAGTRTPQGVVLYAQCDRGCHNPFTDSSTEDKDDELDPEL